MTSGLLIEIVLGVLALAVGLYFGLPGRDRRTLDELEDELAKPGHRKRVRRRFVAVDYLQRRLASSERRDAARRRFHTVAPEVGAESAGEPAHADDDRPDDRTQ